MNSNNSLSLIKINLIPFLIFYRFIIKYFAFLSSKYSFGAEFEKLFDILPFGIDKLLFFPLFFILDKYIKSIA